MSESREPYGVSPLNLPADGAIILPDKNRALLLALRQALILALGAIETYLDMPRTIPNARERRRIERYLLTIE